MASILAIALELKRLMAASFFRVDCVFTQFVLQRLQKERACTSKVQGLPSLFGCPIDRPRQGKHYIQSLLHISL
jgi:hypothetical protein